MTRGYLVLLKNKKIVKVAYSNSDSYYSGLGVNVLNSLRAGEDGFEELIEQTINNEDLEGFNFSWYRRSIKNKDNFFVDYVYEYDATKKILSIYYYGKKILSFGLDQLNLATFVFESEKIGYAFAYNQENLTLDFEIPTKEIKKAFDSKMTVAELSTIVDEKFNNIGFCLNEGKIKGFDRDNYKKQAYFPTRRERFEFIIYQYNFGKKYFSIYIQTPFVRKPLFRQNFSSEKATLKALTEFLKTNKNKLIEVYKIYTLWDDQENKLDNLLKEFKNNEGCSKKIILEKFEKINNEFKKILTKEISNEINSFNGLFTKNELICEFNLLYKNYLNNLKE